MFDFLRRPLLEKSPRINARVFMNIEATGYPRISDTLMGLLGSAGICVGILPLLLILEFMPIV